MIKEYVVDLASQMGITPSRVILTEGKSLGCLDAHVLEIASGEHVVGVLIHQSELEDMQNNYLLELKITSALERLKILTAP
jgi:hypothetical protein